MSIKNFRLRMSTTGTTLREEHIASSRMLLNSTFKDDPSYRDDVVVWGKDVQIPARVYEHTYKESTATRRSIQTPIDFSFSVGQIFKMGDEGYWLCIEAFNAHQTYYQGIVEYCNYMLNFISGGKIHSYPIVMKNSTQYNSGETNRNQMILGNSQHMIFIPCTEDTVRINNGHRFLLDRNRVRPSAFRLTQVDTTTYAYGEIGYMQWTVTEDQFSPERDNTELMIADYYTTSKPMYTIQTQNATSPLTLGVGDAFSLQITALKDGLYDESIPVEYESSNPSVATVSKLGVVTGVSAGNCYIRITYGDAIEKIDVHVSSTPVSDIYSLSILDPDGDSKVIIGDTKTFWVGIYLNGIVQSAIPFEAEIMSYDEVALISELKPDSVLVTALDNEENLGKAFILHVWNADLGIDYSLDLKVGGLWDD